MSGTTPFQPVLLSRSNRINILIVVLNTFSDIRSQLWVPAKSFLFWSVHPILLPLLLTAEHFWTFHSPLYIAFYLYLHTRKCGFALIFLPVFGGILKQSENPTHVYKLIYNISALSFNNGVTLRWKSQYIFQMINGNV